MVVTVAGWGVDPMYTYIIYTIYIVWLVLECFLGVLLARICGRSSEIRLRSRVNNRHFSQHPFSFSTISLKVASLGISQQSFF